MMELVHECMPEHYMTVRMRLLSAYLVLFFWILLASLLAHAYRYPVAISRLH